MISKLDRPFRPIKISESPITYFSLLELGSDLHQEPAFETNGRTAVTLAKSDDLTLVLTALKRGSGLEEHKAPSSITVVVLQGRIKFNVSDRDGAILEKSQSVVLFGGVPHSVDALEDSTILIAIGGHPSE